MNRSRKRRSARLFAPVVLVAAAVLIPLSLSSASRRSPSGPASSTPAAQPGDPPSSPSTANRDAPQPASRQAGLTRMLGQMIVTSFAGSTPSHALLARIRAGQVGGVILFAGNVAAGLPATHALTAELQRAARRGGNPPLLIMTDQEGGAVRRLPGPPTLAPSAMASSGVAFAQGQRAGRLLRSAGINVDLAPVADVEHLPNFLGSRSFGSSPAVVAPRACAFAAGLASQHVAYTLKHFPGLGRAGGNTDSEPVTIGGPASELRADYLPYRSCGSGPLALVMVSNASYPSLADGLPAVMSPAIYQHELPLALGGQSAVTISDDLQARAIAGHVAPARHAINAGLDLVLYAGTEAASAAAYRILLSEARAGRVSSAHIRLASRAIRALKRRLTAAT